MNYFDNYTYDNLWQAVCVLNPKIVRGYDEYVFNFIPSLIAYYTVIDRDLNELEEWALRCIKSAHYHVITDGYYHIHEESL